MDSITLENYRCFREKQTARLAPLTLLVGENSTGKTSFLALIRALWDVAIAERVPDFREEPYDLGSFREIAHNRGARGSRAESFEASFETTPPRTSDLPRGVTHSMRFAERNGAPYPVERGLSVGDSWCTLNLQDRTKPIFLVGTNGKTWKYSIGDFYLSNDAALFPLSIPLFDIPTEPGRKISPAAFVKLLSDEQPGEADYKGIQQLENAVSIHLYSEQRPFASAPVHSRPRRTYDPIRPSRDPEGESTPSYLAELYRREPTRWNHLKQSLEEFGNASGLFHEIAIKSFGNSAGSPFQVEVRKFDSGKRGLRRNLIDVGYGVSQALPVLTELSRVDSPPILLLQQPEVHLHPSAQAALGTLLCQVSGQSKQLMVETHSDYIVDRVRMGVRDNIIRPENVSILFFERFGLDVKIHSLEVDELGNVLNAPPSYGQFFMEELDRSVGL